MNLLNIFKRKGKKSFDAVTAYRRNPQKIFESTKINFQLRQDLMPLLMMSRDLAENDSYYREYLEKRARNIVSADGFKLQMRVKNIDGMPDNIINDIIENGWYKWSSATAGFCTMDGLSSFKDLCIIIDRCFAVDGEAFIQIIKGANNPFGISLYIIDAMTVDHLYNVDNLNSNGDYICMGVECDKYGREIAYHIRQQKSNSATYYSGERVRISAENIIHLFKKEFAGQARGFPVAASVIQDIQMLKAYKVAELEAARAGAIFFLGLEKKENQAQFDPLTEGKNANGVPSMDVESGTVSVVPDGYKLNPISATHPAGNFDGFVKSILKSVASGLGMSYNQLASDLEAVNFSSLRAGMLEERDGWISGQNWLIDNFVLKVFDAWLLSSLTYGALIFTFGKNAGQALSITKLDKYNKPCFNGRRWAWVDPLKDINAQIIAINNGLKSVPQVMAEMGLDSGDTLQDMIAWDKLKAEYNFQTQADKLITLQASQYGAILPNADSTILEPDEDEADKPPAAF